MVNLQQWEFLNKRCATKKAQLVAVSKTKPVEAIEALYQAGQRIFGENRAQEMQGKFELLPKDIEWHMIGHLQKNKLKYIAPFVSLIHSVDSMALLEEINKRAAQNNRIIPCLLQVHINKESQKFGFSIEELTDTIAIILAKELKNVQINGLMGMASFVDNSIVIRQQFDSLKTLFDQSKEKYFKEDATYKTISMGMSGDFEIALECGSTMLRVGSSLFGSRS
ncbi:UNVERIFIED_CONTAM: hypothetical protein GTU68_014275 [Idotea baltica]|nr:hypothetical protein [Idotea baltica]